MRLQLNLNKYYEGLDKAQINTLFSLFVNSKYVINDVSRQMNRLKEDTYQPTEVAQLHHIISRERALRAFKAINDYMRSLGKEEIFKGVDTDDIEEVDFESLINQYNYLMSKPDETQTEGWPESKEAIDNR